MQYPEWEQGAGRGGRGRGRGGYGFGPGGECVCSNCGYKEPHRIGVPCYNLKCPKCGVPLRRGEQERGMA
ncbi:MAG: hypothetical protein AB1665_05545 [Candidatus Thermoplasmatota archaeon]